MPVINPILTPFMRNICYVSLQFLLHLNSFSWVYIPFRGKHVFVRVYVGFSLFIEQRRARDNAPYPPKVLRKHVSKPRKKFIFVRFSYLYPLMVFI